MNRKIVLTEEGGTWSAHDSGSPSVFGVGPTRKAALADLTEATALLVDYKAGEVDEDGRLAGEVCDEVLAGVPGRRRLVGIISDVHGDHVSLGAVLARLRALEVDMVLCAGDVVDGEPFGEECVTLLREAGVVTIKGNHERWRLDGFLAEAGTGEELSRKALVWLRGLPTRWEAEIEGTRVVMIHGDREADRRGPLCDWPPARQIALLAELRADVLGVGHTHDAFQVRMGETLVVNPGSCSRQGVPSGEREATFGVLELPARRFEVHSLDATHRAARASPRSSDR